MPVKRPGEGEAPPAAAPALAYPLLYYASAACELAGKPFATSPPLRRQRAAWFNSTRAFDIGKARRILGYQPKIRPENGLKDMVQSYQTAGWLS